MALTDEQWALYEERYGKLMHTISMKISGDDAVANHEDNYSDLCVAAIESVSGFEKKTGMSFDEAFDTKLFDQYTKTVLWNRKAKKGVPLTKRMNFRNKQVSLDSDPWSEDGNIHRAIEDTRSNLDLSAIDFKDFMKNQPKDVKKVVSAIIKDPNILANDGKINYSALTKPTGMSIHYVKKAVNKIKDVLDKENLDAGIN
jgi:hypothetical protein